MVRPSSMQVGIAIVYGPQAALFSELFSSELRYSGASVSYQVGGILGGGFAPIISAGLFAATRSPVAVAGYVVVLSLIATACSFGLKETFRRDLTSAVVTKPSAEPAAPA